MIADANVLIRAVVQDDLTQASIAMEALREADQIAITIPALCEFVWVLEQRYHRPRNQVGRSIRELISDHRVTCDRSAVLAGLAMQDAGGDFADGVIAFAGRQLGCDIFLTFDRKAAKRVQSTGGAVKLLGP